MQVIQFLVVLFGVGFTMYQVLDIKHNQLDKKYNLYTISYDRLNTGTNRAIYSAINSNSPLLATQGGKFSEEEVGDYLNELQDVYTKLDRGLIDPAMVCEGFYFTVKDTISNKYIEEFISERRIDYADSYFGVDALVEATVNCQ